MPWKVSGTFVRINAEAYEGSDIWQQDQIVGIKIIATRHDIHDQDLADGISATLNIDGHNAMRADLKMGGKKISGMADGTLTDDAAAYGQILGNSAWGSPAPNDLTLLDRDGNTITTVNIPTSGGGGGGVQSVTRGDSMEGAGTSITNTGTIDLKDIHSTDINLTNGISQIQYDKYGRILSATSGAFASTELEFISRTASQLKIRSSTGNQSGVVVPLATSSLAGIITAAQFNALAGAAGMKPPIEIVGVDYATNDGMFFAIAQSVASFTQSFGSVQNVWEDVLSYTGEGVIEFLGVAANGLLSDTDCQLIIDGEVVFTQPNIWAGGEADGNGFVLIGVTGTTSNGATAQVKFNTSFQLQMQHNGGGLASVRIYNRYQKWG